MDRSRAAKKLKSNSEEKRKVLKYEKKDDPNQNAVRNFVSPITTPMLSPETWMHAFEYISRNEDLLSVITACPEWNQMLSTKKGEFLFPLVLPLIIRNLDFKTILACRKVNKSTKMAVDDTVKNDLTSPEKIYKLINYLPTKDREYYGELYNFEEAFLFQEMTKVNKFLSTVGYYRGNNSIIGGKLACGVQLCRQIGQNNLMSLFHLESLLKRFGKHLRYLELVFTNCPVCSSAEKIISTTKLVELLAYVPNVEVLSFTSAQHVIKMGKIEKQFPEMKKLRYIQFLENLPYTFISRLVSHYGDQLTILDCKEVFFTARKSSPSELKLRLPNVRKVCVDQITANGLQKLSSVHWALTHLRVQNFNRRKRPTWEEFVSSISGFKETLIELEIYDHVRGLKTQGHENGPAAFPKLTCVTSNYHYMCKKNFYRFLLTCVSLRKLEFHVYSRYMFEADVDKAKQTLVDLPKVEQVVLWHNSGDPTRKDYTEYDKCIIYRTN
ncbi:unnamed protein product [Orchesella dallaii]|uniref:F-box domain-containing protein n=1 Tax=Orchesella dallaii TaxID=48710 RepID=A0ABP1RKP6_9HEXA